MDQNPNPDALYWESTYAIILDLKRVYPDVNLDEVGTEQLLHWIIALPNFADDPAFVNEDILVDVLREWYEEVNPL